MSPASCSPLLVHLATESFRRHALRFPAANMPIHFFLPIGFREYIIPLSISKITGVYGNLPSLNAFYFHAIRTLWKYLNRRSQRKSYNLAGFKQLMEQFGVAKPHIVGRPKRALMRVAPGLA